VPDKKTIEICNKVVRAALASSVASREGMPFARADLGAKDIAGKPHLSLVRHDLFGYAMGDSLLPIAQMQDRTGADEEREEGITWLDQQLDDTKADLHDRLLNLSPEFDLNVSVGIGDNPTLNIVYEDILRHAQFAGAVESNSSASKAARKLLFPEDANGIRKKSAVYQAYEGYADSVSNIQIQLNEARIAGDLDTVRTLESELLRTRAEWKALGQKTKVEKALKVLEAADRDAGFEDERNRFIEILEARKVGRLSSALDYASVRLVPLEPLKNPDASTHWTELVLSGADFETVLDPKERSLFSISLEEQEKAASLVREARLEYTVVMLDREWLREDFLSARYWRHSDRTLSDGKGGGEAPTVVTKAIFVRSVESHIDEGLEASDKRSSTKTSQKMMLMHQAVLAPISASLMQASKTLSVGKNLDSVQLKKPVASKLTKRQTTNITNMLKVHTIGSKSIRPARRASAVSARTTIVRPAAKRARTGQATTRTVSRKPVRVRRASKRTVNAKKSGRATVRRATLKPAIRAVNVKPAIATLNPKIRTGIGLNVAASSVLQNTAATTVATNNLILKGRIEIGPNVDLVDLVVSYKRVGAKSQAVGEETTLLLTRDGSNQLRFGVTVSKVHLSPGKPNVRRKQPVKSLKIRQTTLTGVHFFLRDSSGTVLIDQVVKFGTKTLTKEIFWNTNRNISVLQLTPVLDPTLYAYAVEILPKSPNPDEQLDWSGSI